MIFKNGLSFFLKFLDVFIGTSLKFKSMSNLFFIAEIRRL